MYQLNSSQSRALDNVIANASADLTDSLRELYCAQNPAEEKRAVLLVRQGMVDQVASELVHQGDSV